jgi:DNA-binding protein YbaB
MFNKLRQLKDLRDQAKKVQNALSGESVTVEKNGIKIMVNGNMEVTSITLNKELSYESTERILVDVTNDAIKKMQKIMAQKIQEMGGIPGLG